jgi:hypothetical protein
VAKLQVLNTHVEQVVTVRSDVPPSTEYVDLLKKFTTNIVLTSKQLTGMKLGVNFFNVLERCVTSQQQQSRSRLARLLCLLQVLPSAISIKLLSVTVVKK